MRKLSTVCNLTQRCMSTTSTTSSTLKSFDTIPGPPSLPGVGTLNDFRPRLQNKNFDEVFIDYYKQYGPIIKQDFGGKKEVWLFRPDDCLEGLRQEGQFPAGVGSNAWSFRVSMQESGHGIGKFGSNKFEEWQTARRQMQKDMFPPSAAESYLPLLDDTVKLVSKQIAKVGEEEKIDEFTPYAAMDLFFTVMLGKNPKVCLAINKDGKGYDPEDEKFAKNAAATISLAAAIGRDPTLNPNNRGPNYPKFNAAFTATLERCEYYFDKFFEEYKPNNQDTTTTVPFYFERLLNRGEMTPQEAKQEVASLLFAGVDTTHHVLLWLIFNLARNPDKQEILRQELNKVLGDGPLLAEHLKSLPYLHQVIRESHRLHTPTPFTVFRYLPKDGSVAGYHIPKDTKVVISTSAIQKDPKYIDQPDDFLPERWRSEEVAARKGTEKELIDHKLLAKPFGYGARMCLGARVAEVEIKAAIARIVRDWKFEWSPKQQNYKIIFTTFSKPEPFPKLSFKPA